MKKFLLIFITLPCLVFTEQVREPFKVAAVEFNPMFMELEKNIQGLVDAANKTASQGAKLIVFPEMVTCGYIYKDRAQIEPFLDTIPGKTTEALTQVCKKHDVYITVGIGEKDPETRLGYNAAALIGPNGYIGKYRKVGLNSTDQFWVAPGNLGHPVFETPLGNIAMLICYDDIYFQTSRLPALRGADIIAYSVSSDRALLDEPSAIGNHSTVANVQYMSAWNGVHLIVADRSNSEANPETGLVVHYNGASTIWDGNGNKIAQLPYTDVSSENTDAPKILFATIDPKTYDNPIKRQFERRRPELYGDLALFRAPTDPKATKKSQNIFALALQYEPEFGNVNTNLNKIRQLLKDKKNVNLVVLPAYSLTGHSFDSEAMKKLAQSADGSIVGHMVDRAVEFNTHLLFSFLELFEGNYYHTAHLINPKGQLVGAYRKSHLNKDESWMKAGNQLPIFETDLGRIAIELDDEVLIPEVSGVYSIKRADIIAIPSKYDADSIGNPIQIEPKLFIKPIPSNTMIYWYAIAQTAQSYTIVANFVGSMNNYKGSSGLYSLNPVMGHYPPQLASNDKEEAFEMKFATLGNDDWWMNQHKLVGGRRADLAVPLMLLNDSSKFREWKQERHH